MDKQDVGREKPSAALRPARNRRKGAPPQDFVTAGPRTLTEHLVDGPDDLAQDDPGPDATDDPRATVD
jgi:hypothetical protein